MNVLMNFKKDTTGLCAMLTRYINFLDVVEKKNWTPSVNWPANKNWLESGENIWPMLFQQQTTDLEFTKHYTENFNIKEWHESMPNDDNIVRYMVEIPKHGKFQNLYPRNKTLANKLISKYIKPRKSIMRKVDLCCLNHIEGNRTIGVHCRGPGRLHGGVGKLHTLLGIDGVPYEEYFNILDDHIQDYDKIFLATDADVVRSVFKKRYGNLVTWETHELPTEGEAHASRNARYTNPSAKKLFEMCLIDMYTLSRCDLFVFGNSNVPLYVQCLNADLITKCVYDYDILKRVK